jgi:hypothetical protein
MIKTLPTIPTDASSHSYADDMAEYLDHMLDEALEETFPASDAVAVPQPEKPKNK